MTSMITSWDAKIEIKVYGLSVSLFHLLAPFQHHTSTPHICTIPQQMSAPDLNTRQNHTIIHVSTILHHTSAHHNTRQHHTTTHVSTTPRHTSAPHNYTRQHHTTTHVSTTPQHTSAPPISNTLHYHKHHCWLYNKLHHLYMWEQCT